jgi:hypothetical protein
MLQKQNHIIRSHIIVAITWYIALFFIGYKFDISSFSTHLAYSLAVLFFGAGTGFISYLLIAEYMKISNTPIESESRDALLSIGKFPKTTPITRTPISSSKKISAPWFPAYQRDYPLHANAFKAVLEVMNSKPDLPASPIKGGHGGATLIEHSFNVVAMMFKKAPAWRYVGHKNKSGKIIFPLIDMTKTEFKFDPQDPILPLTAFAHDIGKITCYDLKADGSIVEVKRNHDIEGAKILRTLPEVMALPWKDQMALLIACEYYHHQGSLPQSMWIDDRARSLIELLLDVDVATGKAEGGIIVDDNYDYDDNQPAHEDITAIDSDEASDQSQQITANQSINQLSSSGFNAGTAQDSPPESLINNDVFRLASTVLSRNNAINGRNSKERIAYKHGEWLYIHDAKLRSAIAEETGDESYARTPKQGVMSDFTLELMAILSAHGYLLQEFNGKYYSEKRAIFTTGALVKEQSIETRFVIIVSIKAFPWLSSIEDCKIAPNILGCSWGEAAATSKKPDAVTSTINNTAVNVDIANQANINDQADQDKISTPAITAQPDVQSAVQNNDVDSQPQIAHDETLATAPIKPVEVSVINNDEPNITTVGDAEAVRQLAASYQIPFVEKADANGKTMLIIKKEIMQIEFPTANLNHADFTHIKGEKGEYIGVYK